jgi:hypothetical protein
VITAIVAASTGCFGFGAGVIYAVRRYPAWIADMSDAQLARLLAKAEKARFGS